MFDINHPNMPDDVIANILGHLSHGVKSGGPTTTPMTTYAVPLVAKFPHEFASHDAETDISWGYYRKPMLTHARNSAVSICLFDVIKPKYITPVEPWMMDDY